jgi:hypothetical protein
VSLVPVCARMDRRVELVDEPQRVLVVAPDHLVNLHKIAVREYGLYQRSPRASTHSTCTSSSVASSRTL